MIARTMYDTDCLCTPLIYTPAPDWVGHARMMERIGMSGWVWQPVIVIGNPRWMDARSRMAHVGIGDYIQARETFIPDFLGRWSSIASVSLVSLAVQLTSTVTVSATNTSQALNTKSPQTTVRTRITTCQSLHQSETCMLPPHRYIAYIREQQQQRDIHRERARPSPTDSSATLRYSRPRSSPLPT